MGCQNSAIYCASTRFPAILATTRNWSAHISPGPPSTFCGPTAMSGLPGAAWTPPQRPGTFPSACTSARPTTICTVSRDHLRIWTSQALMAEPFDRLKEALADRYTLERELGAGGMATVYLAHDVRHTRKVAIRVMHADRAARIDAARFLQDMASTRNPRHPP